MMATERMQREIGTGEILCGAFGLGFPIPEMAHRGVSLLFPGSGMAERTLFLAFPGSEMAEGTSCLPFPKTGTGRGRFAGRFRGPGMGPQTVEPSCPSSCLGTRLSAKLCFAGGLEKACAEWERARGSGTSGTGAFPSRSLGTRGGGARGADDF